MSIIVLIEQYSGSAGYLGSACCMERLDLDVSPMIIDSRPDMAGPAEVDPDPSRTEWMWCYAYEPCPLFYSST